MTTRQQRSREERVRWVAKWRASGLSGAMFAKRHDLNESTLYRWAQVMGSEPRAAAAGPPSTQTPTFTQVRVSGGDRLDNGVIEIALPAGRLVRLHGEVAAAQLQVVLEALAGC